MTHEEIKQAWNNEADEYNCWDALGEDEQVMFAYRKGLEEAISVIIEEIDDCHSKYAIDSIRERV